MRKILLLIIFLIPLVMGSGMAMARGGQGADDCPPGSTDPDCVKAAGK